MVGRELNHVVDEGRRCLLGEDGSGVLVARHGAPVTALSSVFGTLGFDIMLNGDLHRSCEEHQPPCHDGLGEN